WTERNCLPPKRDIFSILMNCAQYRYESPLPALKGKVVEGDVRRASTLLRSYREKVRLVVTSPPYLDITDYHEDQWLRLWFLGGPSKPVTGQGKDDRHRRVEAYWQFLREAWKGVVPLLQDKAQVVIRIGGTRLDAEELQAGLLDSLTSTGRKFKLAESRQTNIKNGQRRIFQTVPDKVSVEHDFRFRLA
ncbi:MAG TPA: DNA methylase, partial [Terriglobia bacterium]|nr:DNA methylase [Terriglobia bacterium]